MAGPNPTVLVLDDDRAFRDVLKRGLPQYQIITCGTIEAARARLSPLPEVVLTDVNLVGENGIEFCRDLVAQHPQLPVLVMTAFGDLPMAVDALRGGAYDFLTKPLDFKVLSTALERAVEAHRLRKEVSRLRRQVHRADTDNLAGDSEPMRRLKTLLRRIAPAPSAVMIRGESGTGKELVARRLHELSGRRAGPFVPVNCAAIPESLIEAEFFGFTRGAFTDAHRPRKGLLPAANGGTLFLDEIGDLPLQMQSKLLRALQEKRVRPVGSDDEIPIDIRVLSATHQDLELMVEQRGFREDLLYRLDVIRVDLPPLRERGRDVLLLAQRFAKQVSEGLGIEPVGISEEAARTLLQYAWPGNVRELMNCIERAVVLTTYKEVQVDDLPAKVRTAAAGRTTVLAVPGDPEAMPSLADVEKRYIEQVLDAVDGRRSEAARILKLDRKTLYRKLERWRTTTPE